jgi:RNA polymerase sigma-70 factor (ECF subfamily)
VLEAGSTSAPGAQEALETLCRSYWPPLYAYVRRRGCPPEEAQDLVQDFFARFLAKRYFGQADPARGRFRHFLLTAMQHFLANERKKTGRQKRGGDQILLSWDAERAEADHTTEPVDWLTPERAYLRRWALTVLEHGLDRLRAEQHAAGKDWVFERLAGFIWGDRGAGSYADLGAQCQMSEGHVKVTVHRLRRRYGQLLREEIAQTVARSEDVDEELRFLMQAVSD